MTTNVRAPFSANKQTIVDETNTIKSDQNKTSNDKLVVIKPVGGVETNIPTLYYNCSVLEIYVTATPCVKTDIIVI